MENEERKIIKRFPLPEMELTEEELNDLDANTASGPAQFAMLSTVAALTDNTKKLSYTAAIINDKLAHTNTYAITSHTFDSYVNAISVSVAQTGDSRYEGTYLIVPFGDFINGPGGTSSAIVNFKVWVKDGIIRTLRATCIAGRIDTSKFEVLAGDFKDNDTLFRLFIKSNGFRGSLMIRELSLDVNNVVAGIYYRNDLEYTNIVPQWNLFPAKYDNVASEVKGYATPFEMKISQIPTSEADLFRCLFGGENQGPDNWMDLYATIESGILPQIVLTCNVGNYSFATITTNVDLEFDEDLMEFAFHLYFVYFGKYYNLGFKLADDGVAVPGSASVTIKAL